MVEIAGIVLLIQGVLGFAGPAFWDRDMGVVHLVADLPPVAYLAMAAVGAVLTVVGGRRRKAKERRAHSGERREP
ncbi:hypothetical protein [Allonocardiopsis opalescens]|uniref:Uncharacterized protein n=1 Tax=Allonocardiopsis opalescens TaxID=1144618 RepID=A0A2T0QCV2_9ACTN|nr:hypothetical protein [Allonocardiopsis opalescens]PRY01700.1 hypothetical protein CLV72_101284 [Allonocardiopsis opalescens]